MCDLEKKEVKADVVVCGLLASYMTATDEKGTWDVYSLACGEVTLGRMKTMCKAVKNVAWKIKRQIIKKEIKKMFGDLGNGKTS